MLKNIPPLTVYKLRSLVPYLSPSDATTVEEFNDSELSSDYENKNHLFDVFASFCGYDDSIYLQIDMLNHIANNNTRCEWDAHVLLTMHGSNLAQWCAKMTDPLNKGDELCVYTLCGMLKWHAFIFTKTKPWITVDGSIADLTMAELCIICDMHLIFLGDNNFGVLKYKPHIQSPLNSPATQSADDKPNQTLDQMQSSETSTGMMVGILNEDLHSGMVVTLPQSPISVELEATKGLLALKSEGKTTNKLLEKSPSGSLPGKSPVQSTATESETPSSLSQVSKSENIPKETVELTKQTENIDLPNVNECP